MAAISRCNLIPSNECLCAGSFRSMAGRFCHKNKLARFHVPCVCGRSVCQNHLDTVSCNKQQVRQHSPSTRRSSSFCAFTYRENGGGSTSVIRIISIIVCVSGIRRRTVTMTVVLSAHVHVDMRTHSCVCLSLPA